MKTKLILEEMAERNRRNETTEEVKMYLSEYNRSTQNFLKTRLTINVWKTKRIVLQELNVNIYTELHCSAWRGKRQLSCNYNKTVFKEIYQY